MDGYKEEAFSSQKVPMPPGYKGGNGDACVKRISDPQSTDENYREGHEGS